MKLREAAQRGITRLALFRDGKPVWNPYSFGDINVCDDGTMGPWMWVYDPCGQLACGNPMWKSIPVLTFPNKSQISVGPDDEFEPYVPPLDMHRFPGYPPMLIVRPAPGKSENLKTKTGRTVE